MIALFHIHERRELEVFTHYLEAASKISADQVVTIGNFDGIHVGHQKLIGIARSEANQLGIDASVLTFEPRPISLLSPESAPSDLLTAERKRSLFQRLGMNNALFQRFDSEFADISAEFFAKGILSEALRAKVVVVGRNFRFGKNRSAGIEELTSFGQRLGFEVKTASLAEIDGEVVSSSRIRSLLGQGDVKKAAELLGRRYEVGGRVAKDRGVGRTMGFPTVNLENIRVMSPKSGIYAAKFEVGGVLFDAAVYIGERPTMDAGFAVEAHLLDFEGDLYGRRSSIHFVDRIRDDRKFEDTPNLILQISEDIGRIRTVLEESE